MYEYLSKMDPDLLMRALITLVIVGGGLLCTLIAILGYLWHAVRKLEAALKQDMLNRGMTAEEMRTVLEVSASGFPPSV
jgi:hypothetical protein